MKRQPKQTKKWKPRPQRAYTWSQMADLMDAVADIAERDAATQHKLAAMHRSLAGDLRRLLNTGTP